MLNKNEALVMILAACLVFGPVTPAWSAPQGGKVVSGNAAIKQSGNRTSINQSSDRAIINWHSFDIAKNESVHHQMPSASSAALHRVVGGGGASQIQGLLQSNGNIYLVNPAGVVIHQGAQIKTNSFTATSRDITNENFMQKKMVFDQPGRADAKIINSGTISVNENGLAALVAPTVRNDGVIAGKLAKVALASGNSTYKLDMYGDDLITFTVSENDVDALRAADGTPLASAEVKNTGSIKTDGGVVVMTAAQLDGIVGAVVNSGDIEAGEVTFTGRGSQVSVSNTGRIDASSAVADGGRVRMDSDATLSASGSIKATGAKNGGHIALTGEDIKVAANTSIDASGSTGGGTVLIGGNWQGKGPERNAKTTTVDTNTSIRADATSKGDGGTVVVWSDNKTVFDGQISAQGGALGGNGGQVETSGKELKLGDNAHVTTVAANGLYGKWLIDPDTWTISDSGNQTAAEIEASLSTANVTIGTYDSIFVDQEISWTADTTLTFNATNIAINENISALGNNAGLVFSNDFKLKNGKKITLSGSNATLNIAGNAYIIINNIADLQNMYSLSGGGGSGFYALGGDIDATTSSSLNGGEGFKPIGTDSAIFSGVFNGLGNAISGLKIGRFTRTHSDTTLSAAMGSGGGLYPNIISGLFHAIGSGGSVLNLILQNIDVTSSHRIDGSWTGAIAGLSSSTSTINNVYTSGQIYGDVVGGLIGYNVGTISNSSSSAVVTGLSGSSDAGGLVGYNMGNIYTSFSSGSVSSEGSAGGIAGVHVTNSYIDSSSNVIQNSYSIADVYGEGYVGGLVGGLESNDINSNIINCYSAGSVSGTGVTTGGTIGLIYGNKMGYVENTYWNKNTALTEYELGETSSKPANWSLTALTTEEMTSKNSFSGWDFSSTWGIEEGVSYPYLYSNAQIFRPSTSPSLSPSNPGQLGDCSPSPTPSNGDKYHSSVKEELDKDYDRIEVNTIIKDPWISTEVNGYNDYLSDLTQDTDVEVSKTADSLASIINAGTELNQDMPVDIESLQAYLEGFLQDAVGFEEALRNLLPNYFIRKANEQIQIANWHLKKASLAYTGEMADAMESLVNARIYAIVAQAVANKNTDKVEQISDLPPLVESLYWSGEVEKGLGKNAMQAVNVDSSQAMAASTYNVGKPGEDGVTTEEKVMESLNKTLDTVFTTLWKSTEMLQGAEGESITSRATTSMADALKNDEMLQRYIDLHNFYIQKKMSFAAILLG